MTAVEQGAPPNGRVPRLDDETARRVAFEVAMEARQDAARRDEHRLLPQAVVRRLRETGVLAMTVPEAYGGAGLRASTLCDVIRILAAADPNLAQIPHSHFVYTYLLRLADAPALQEEVFAEILEGGQLGNAQSELRSRTTAHVETRLTRTAGSSYVLNGTKGYCTGALFATRIPVLARLGDEEGREVVAYVPYAQPGLTVVDDWDAIGQRTTASGRVELDRVSVREGWLIDRRPLLTGPYGYGAYAQVLHAAIDVGIAEEALQEAAGLVRSSARPHFEAGVERAEDDPLTIQRFGDLDVDVRAARAQLDVAARAVDVVEAEPGDDHAVDASLAVAAAKVLADRAAMATTNGLFEVVGTRSASGSARLDRHWRNARTHTLHDPVRWKLQHLGRFALTGAAPPRHGQL